MQQRHAERAGESGDEERRPLVPRAGCASGRDLHREHERRDLLGRGARRIAHDAPVGEEEDAVGVARGDRVVRDHRDRWPCSRLAAASRPSTSRPVRESRLPVGSSANTRSGRVASARAIATRCCCPPESSCGGGRSAVARARGCRRARRSTPAPSRLGRRPSSSNGSMMLPRTSSVGTRLNDWNTKPTRRRRSTVRARVGQLA